MIPIYVSPENDVNK